MSKEAKQVIVMRRDLKMRRGKECAQAAHASIAFLTDFGADLTERDNGTGTLHRDLHPAAVSWIKHSFVKICARVDSEAALLQLAADAQAAGLTVALIQDEGRTEFDGVKTYTCCAIGPNWSEEIDPITGHLALL